MSLDTLEERVIESNKETTPDEDLKSSIKMGEDIKTVYYSCGEKVHYEITMKDGLREGITKVYSYSGNLMFTSPYKKGRIEGIQKWYYPTGEIQREIPFKNDHPHGVELEYKKDGSIWRETLFCKGKVEWSQGVQKWYYPTGELKRERYFRNDNAHGVELEYEKDGTIWRETLFCKGRVGWTQGIQNWYYSTGELKRERYFRNDHPHGIELSYKKDGSIWRETLFCKGKVEWSRRPDEDKEE